MSLIVQKYGGTSVGSIERIHRVAERIVDFHSKGHSLVVVLSAMQRLGVQPATVEPKATEHMAEIINLVHALIEKGLAYQVDGDVYFEVGKFSGYGKLSKRKLEDMQAGARVEVDERKRSPMDFALWKASKAGEPAWKSPCLV